MLNRYALKETGASFSGFGWSEAEDKLLFDKAADCKRSGRPLRSAFVSVAEATGRKPNSVRNRYYMILKQCNTELLSARESFTPFADEEVRSLIKEVLRAVANGESVRSCALRLGGGENKAMLRYQNKYRAVIKRDPQLVKSVLAELKSEGVNARDPYEAQKAAGVNGSNAAAELERAVRSLSALSESGREFVYDCIKTLAGLAEKL